MRYIDHGEIMDGFSCREIDMSIVAYDGTQTIAVFSQTLAFRGLARGLAETGYSIKRYVATEGGATLEHLDKLARYLTDEGTPDGAVVHVEPDAERLFLHSLSGRMPLIILRADPQNFSSTNELTTARRPDIRSCDLAAVIGYLLAKANCSSEEI